MNTVLATPEKPAVVINFAKIIPLFQPATDTSLVRTRNSFSNAQLIHRDSSPVTALVRHQPRSGETPTLAEMPTHTMAVPRGKGTMSRMNGTVDLASSGVVNLDLPFGMPQFINAATLKRMLNAKRSELLLKRTGARWIVCEDSTRIDLLDDSVEFRLGAVQIFS